MADDQYRPPGRATPRDENPEFLVGIPIESGRGFIEEEHIGVREQSETEVE